MVPRRARQVYLRWPAEQTPPLRYYPSRHPPRLPCGITTLAERLLPCGITHLAELTPPAVLPLTLSASAAV